MLHNDRIKTSPSFNTQYIVQFSCSACHTATGSSKLNVASEWRLSTEGLYTVFTASMQPLSGLRKHKRRYQLILCHAASIIRAVARYSWYCIQCYCSNDNDDDHNQRTQQAWPILWVIANVSTSVAFTNTLDILHHIYRNSRSLLSLNRNPFMWLERHNIVEWKRWVSW